MEGIVKRVSERARKQPPARRRDAQKQGDNLIPTIFSTLQNGRTGVEGPGTRLAERNSGTEDQAMGGGGGGCGGAREISGR